jgi:hypothetical protein
MFRHFLFGKTEPIINNSSLLDPRPHAHPLHAPHPHMSHVLPNFLFVSYIPPSPFLLLLLPCLRQLTPLGEIFPTNPPRNLRSLLTHPSPPHHNNSQLTIHCLFMHKIGLLFSWEVGYDRVDRTYTIPFSMVPYYVGIYICTSVSRYIERKWFVCRYDTYANSYQPLDRH